MLTGAKKPLMTDGDAEAKAIDTIAEEGEAIKRRVNELTDKKMYPLIQLYESVKTIKKELDDAIVYFKIVS